MDTVDKLHVDLAGNQQLCSHWALFIILCNEKFSIFISTICTYYYNMIAYLFMGMKIGALKKFPAISMQCMELQILISESLSVSGLWFEIMHCLLCMHIIILWAWLCIWVCVSVKLMHAFLNHVSLEVTVIILYFKTSCKWMWVWC